MTELPIAQEDWDIHTHRTELAPNMPEIRLAPGSPLGDDTALLTASLPPYATAFSNPHLRGWLEETNRARSATPYNDPGPFTTDVSAGKSNLVYKAHSYPTKVPHPAIMRFILHYTEPGDVVLDGFSGTGMTGVAAQACGQPDLDVRRDIEAEMGKVRWGPRRAVLSDLSPSAAFIAAGLNLPIDPKAFERRSAEILDQLEDEWGWMYLTTDEAGQERPLDYVVWSEVFTCSECAGEIVFYDVAFDPNTGRVSDKFRCPSCSKELTKNSVDQRFLRVRTLAGDAVERIEMRPVAIHYRIGTSKRSKRPDDADLAKLRRISGLALPGRVPTQELPFMHMTHERAPLPTKGFTHAHHFWGDRALVSLAALWKVCSNETDPLLRHALLFWVEQALWGMSWMNRYKANDHSQVNRAQSGVYYISSLVSEVHPRYNLEGTQPSRGKRMSLVKVWEQSPARLGSVMISTGSSTNLDLPDESIDYVFVDPPFGSNIYYADLAYLVESWHGVWTNSAEEAIVNQSKRAGRTLTEYADLMEACFVEFHRALKPGRWMTVEFNNSSNEVWLTIQQALARAGFVVADTRMIDKEQLSYRQVTATNAVKRDLIISAYKPTSVLAERIEPVMGTPETAWAFVREHLGHLPLELERQPNGEVTTIRERMKDRLWERMEGFHVQRNLALPLTAAEFYAGLGDRFPERDGMHFLDEQVEIYEEQRLAITDLKDARLFITDEDSAVQWLRQFLLRSVSPQPYSAIQPGFFAETQAGLPDWERPPDLKILLERSFLQDEEGRWYVPDPRKEADLERLRRREQLKEFATYTSGKDELKHFSLAAVRAGFSDAWQRGDYAVIVTVGRRLPTNAFTQDVGLLTYFDNAEQMTE